MVGANASGKVIKLTVLGPSSCVPLRPVSNFGPFWGPRLMSLLRLESPGVFGSFSSFPGPQGRQSRQPPSPPSREGCTHRHCGGSPRNNFTTLRTHQRRGGFGPSQIGAKNLALPNPRPMSPLRGCAFACVRARSRMDSLTFLEVLLGQLNSSKTNQKMVLRRRRRQAKMALDPKNPLNSTENGR